MSAPKVTPATRALVHARDLELCVVCGVGGGLTIQHRVARGMGGNRRPWVNEPANLLSLCGSGTTGCHGWTEANPRVADAHGLSAPRWADLTAWLVWTWQGWVQIDNHGAATAVSTTELTTDQLDLLDGCPCGCLSELAPALT